MLFIETNILDISLSRAEYFTYWIETGNETYSYELLSW